MRSSTHTTEFLQAWGNGDQAAFDKLLPHISDELRRLAGYYLKSQRPNHTLQPTALVYKAYSRLFGLGNA